MRNRTSRHIVPAKRKGIDRISIIIPAAGTGTRMKSYGPKSLIHINNDYLINYQLKIIQQQIHIPHEIILIAGYDADRVFKNTPHNIIKIENEHYETTNVVRSIGLGIHACTSENILLIYGDLLFNKMALSVPLLTGSWLSTSTHMSKNEVGCIIDNNNIASLSYDLPRKWSQIGYFTKKEFSLFKNICCKRDNNQLFGFEAINQVIDSGGIFQHIEPPLSKTNDIDSSKDLQSIGHIL